MAEPVQVCGSVRHCTSSVPFAGMSPGVKDDGRGEGDRLVQVRLITKWMGFELRLN